MTALAPVTMARASVVPLINSTAPSLADLPNLGPRSAQMLAGAGIRTHAALTRVGALDAYLRVKRSDASASLNLLYALVGALEGTHWRDVRRQRRLELLTAVEDRQRTAAPRTAATGLQSLRNIGPAMARDFALLGIRSPAQLARAQPDRLYVKLQRLTGKRHDLCVWDTFAAAIHQARTGEALPWWHFTRERKQREAAGSFVPRFAAAPAPRSRRRTQL